MFSNRFYRWKLAAALAAAALMGVYGAKRGQGINPMLWRVVVEPARWDGNRLWVPNARIVATGENCYEISAGDPEARMLVSGPAPGRPGDVISVIGTFRAEGLRLDPERSRVLPPQWRLRWLVEAVSVLVLLVVLADFARHFLFRPRLLQVEGEPHG